MKKIKYIAFSVCVLCSVLCAPAHAQDYARMSERSIMGTARYVGMGGAMTAIGGDPSSVYDNPAGLGLYQRMELMLTFDEMLDYTWQKGATDKNRRTLFMCPQATIVFGLPLYPTSSSGAQFCNFMLGYRRMHTYNRTYDAVGSGGASLGALLPTLDIPFCDEPLNNYNSLHVYEFGYSNEYSLDWALNIGHQWYVGLGLHMQNYYLSSDATYIERFDTINIEGAQFDNYNKTSLQFSGVSCNLSAGIIYRPLRWLRLGFGIQTPTLGSLHTYTSGTFSSQTDSIRNSYAPDIHDYDKNFHLPLHLSSSVAFQCGAYGMASIQYDYLKRKSQDAIHSLRVGLEVIPVMGMYVNAGYVYESTFKSADRLVSIDPTFDRQDAYFMNPKWSQYASVAVGYRGNRMIAQVAYQYRWQRINLYAHENAIPYDMRADTHRIVLSIGWH